MNIKVIRFFLVAGLNTAFGYGLYALLLFVGLHFVWATLIGQVVGILFNFKTYGALVFKNKDNGRIFRFVGVYGFTYLVNIGCISILTHRAGLSDYLAGAILVVPMGFLGFFLNKYLVYNRSSRETEKTAV